MTAWHPVPGWEGYYEASPDGRVRSVPRRCTPGRELRFGRTGNGYLTVTFSARGERRAYTVHRVIAETFLGPRPAGLHTSHVDGDRTNNAVTNLRYITASENEADKRRHGTQPNVNKTHCPRGHEYSLDNTRVDRRGCRHCRTCKRDLQRERRLASRPQAPRAAALPIPPSGRARPAA